MTTAAAIDRRWRTDLSATFGRLTPLVPLAALLLFQQIRYPAPLGIVINGALAGGRIALIAVGIALIYRANRIINFAQGDLGAVPATLGVMLVVAWGWNYWLGLASGLAAAIVLGVLVETLIIRRFFTAPRLVLTVATIGLSQVLAAAGLFLPRAFGNDAFGTRLAPPINLHLPPIGGTTFNSNDILTAIVVPICLVGLALFLYTSTIGIAIVGAAERADRAFTLGIPVKRLHTVVWVIASVLAFLAMFLRAGAVGLPIGQVLSPIFLLQALAACVFGRFERFTMIGAAAIGIGIVDQAMTFQAGSSDAKNAAVLFYIILIGLLVTRRGGTGRVDADSSTTWQAIREIRPVPREMRRLPEVVWGRILIWLAVGGFVVSLPFWLSSSRINLATIIVIFGIVAASLVVLTGWAGQVSLGQMAFVGVGAAVGGALTETRGWDLMFSMPVAGIVGGLCAVVVGYPALRRRGLTLAVSTLGFGLYVSSYVLNRSIFDWLPSQHMERGVMLGFLDLSSEKTMFYVSLGTLLVAMGMVASLRRSRTGRVLDRHPREREGRPRLRRQRHPHDARRLRPVRLPGRHGRGALRPEPDRAQRRAIPARPQPRRVHDGRHRRARLPVGCPPGHRLRVHRRLLPACRVAVPGQRRRPAARPAADAERVRRRHGRRARRRPAPHRQAAGAHRAQPARRRAGRGRVRRRAAGRDRAGGGGREGRGGRGSRARGGDAPGRAGRRRRPRGRLGQRGVAERCHAHAAGAPGAHPPPHDGPPGGEDDAAEVRS